MSEEVTQAARRLRGIDCWGDPYFDIDHSGNAEVRPGSGPPVALPHLVTVAREAGMTLPILFRFKGIRRHRPDRSCSAFVDATARHDCPQRYRRVYSVKVNQQHGVVEPLVEHGGERRGWSVTRI